MNRISRSVNYYCQDDFVICPWQDYDYSKLKNIQIDQKRGRKRERLNEVFIMLDTETSKSKDDAYRIRILGGVEKRDYDDNINYIVKWSIALNYRGINLCCLWGSKPSEAAQVVEMIHNSMRGDTTIIYVHNLSYDWIFLRKFLIRAWGKPEYQLATKPHYPIMIRFENGIEIRDSLILSQRSIQKWGEDLNVQHQKAVGKWEYNKHRDQSDGLTGDELEYICNDVIAGVECLNGLRKILKKRHAGMPYTATGIVRSEARKIGEKHKAHEQYTKCMGDFEWYCAAEKCYHGGYTHANRHISGWVETDVTCYDFASSYPYCMLSEKFPCERFKLASFDMTIKDVLKSGYACMVEFEASNVELKDYFEPMPCMQVAKMDLVINPIVDNGRILRAEFVDMFLTEIDLQLIVDQYNFDHGQVRKCWFAQKDYLPRWLTDYVYKLFKEKTQLKGVDPVQYSIAKSKINSVYGMTVQKVCKDDLIEDYDTGDYITKDKMTEEEYDNVVKRRSSFLPYYIGVYVTAYAMRNLYRLGSCAGTWLYTDTDSVYGCDWDLKKLTDYNNYCKKLLKARGYPGVQHNGREYWLGVAEKDGEYSEYMTLGAKRYCCRDAETGKLKITIAGVPKIGVECLQDDIKNFAKGFVFRGEETGKLTHVYNFVDSIYIDDNGNEVGDSINLIPCDYLLDSAKIDDMFEEEVLVPDYEQTSLL